MKENSDSKFNGCLGTPKVSYESFLDKQSDRIIFLHDDIFKDMNQAYVKDIKRIISYAICTGAVIGSIDQNFVSHARNFCL